MEILNLKNKLDLKTTIRLYKNNKFDDEMLITKIIGFLENSE